MTRPGLWKVRLKLLQPEYARITSENSAKCGQVKQSHGTARGAVINCAFIGAAQECGRNWRTRLTRLINCLTYDVLRVLVAGAVGAGGRCWGCWWQVLGYWWQVLRVLVAGAEGTGGKCWGCWWQVLMVLVAGAHGAGGRCWGRWWQMLGCWWQVLKVLIASAESAGGYIYE
jgi:hypothetical protein